MPDRFASVEHEPVVAAIAAECAAELAHYRRGDVLFAMPTTVALALGD